MFFLLFALLFHSNSVVFGETIDCPTAQECEGQALLTDDYINCDGYESCHLASLVDSDGLTWDYFTCAGDRSCHSVSLLESGLAARFYGDQSGANGNKLVTTDFSGYFLCYGANSCNYINYTNVPDYVECHGVESCADTFFEPGAGYASATSSDGLFYGTSAYALKNSIIKSGGIDLEIQLYGYYAGYNLTIICETGDRCDIVCQGNGCKYTFYICEESGNCDISCDESNSVDCPIERNATMPALQANLVDISEYDPYYYDIYTISNEEQDICDTGPGSTHCDDEYDCGYYNSVNLTFQDDGNILNNICCRGTYTCKDSGIEITSQEPNGNIICSGWRSCYDAGLIDTSEASGSVFCLGYETCYDSIYTPQIKVNVSNNDIVYCGGYYSCNGVEIYNASAVYCTAGDYGCYQAKLYSVQSLYVLGGGVASGHGVDMHSNGVGIMYVHLMAQDASDLTNIRCNTANDTCYIECGAHDACSSTNTYVHCTNGATCYVVCDVSIGLTCPNQATGSYTIIDEMPSTTTTTTTTTEPTTMPSRFPSVIPTFEPTFEPTLQPTANPVVSTTSTTSTTKTSISATNTAVTATTPSNTESGVNTSTSEEGATTQTTSEERDEDGVYVLVTI